MTRKGDATADRRPGGLAAAGGPIRRGLGGAASAGLLLLALVVAWPGWGLAQSEVEVKGGNVVYPLLEVNIADGDRLARLYIGFEAQCRDAEGAQLAASSRTRDALVMFLRTKNAAELSGVAGKRRLKDELVAVMNKAIGAPRVVRLYFLQLVVR
ncbi:MAG: flagellar basal body-associated FliL family protein [Solidesulfovibrio sp.]|uniref:flagellar basal body-associated FliL family protein n=1 Tax=Solidesulfovibrio sp. TaxID=2910990 RepID=UPI002B1FEFE6|nr:flagellar basal body-associated FliL family protein [Solidesulfovibrio sp.]MEA4857929.1 flagellar basal body-associated FliL family protein [Solidesulfovibrio sp.]